MKEPYTEPCVRHIDYALTLLQALDRTPVRDIRCHRRAALIARHAAFDDLRRCFITPIDREDLWLLRQRCEQVATAAEDTVLYLHQRQQTVSPNDTALLAAAVKECSQLRLAVKELPLHSKSERVLQQLADTEKQHLVTAELIDTAPLSDPIARLSDACCAVAEVMRLIVLKAT